MNRICKRFFDVIVASLGLIVAGPIMAVISLMLFVESSWPVIFSQERLGQNGKRFRMHKFRKFPVHWKEGGPGVTTANDIRMTKVGAVLERLKLDELPQLWNILKGEMSFVGPRPETIRFGDLFDGKYKGVLDYVPGIFGPNQIAFRNESELYPFDRDPEDFYRRVLFPQKAENDLRYFQKATVFTDFLFLVRGIWASLYGVLNWRRFFMVHIGILFVDVGLIVLAWSLTFVVRYQDVCFSSNVESYLRGLWAIPLLFVPVMFIFGCYSHPIRHFGLTDATRLIRVISVMWFLTFLLLLGLDRSLSLFLAPIFWFIIISLLFLPRVLKRILRERQSEQPSSNIPAIIIYGAGRAGTVLANWINKGPLKGFVDDDQELRGKYINGHPVLGWESDIPNIHEVYPFEELWVTFRPDRQKKGRLRKICERLDVRLVILAEIEPFSRFIGSSKVCNRNAGEE